MDIMLVIGDSIMKYEYSYGAVVYKIEDGDYMFLLEHMKLGHISLPKGHIEEGETPIECAHREILEETGLDLIIDTSFSTTISYYPQPNVKKYVTFYIAEYKKGDMAAQESEVTSLYWKRGEEALLDLTHSSDRETLKKAILFLQNEKRS